MSYQGQRLNTLGRIRQALQRMIFGRGLQRRRTEFWGADSDIDYESEMGGADNSDIVSSLVGWKQDVFPEAVLMVREKDADGKYQPVEDNPLMPLLDRPNPLYQGLDLFKATIWDYNIDGNAYWWVIRNGRNDIQEIHYLPAFMMEPGYSANQSLEDRYWLYTPYDLTYEIPADQIIHYRDGIDPGDVRVGCSRLKNLYREMYTDSVAADMVAILLRNRAVFGPIITPDKESEYDQGNIEEMKTYILDKFTGGNRGKPLIIGVPTKVTSFGYDSNDSDVTDIRHYAEGRLSAALNVSPIVVSMPSGLKHLTYNNLEVAREMSWENGMLPMLRQFGMTLTEFLMPLVDETGEQEFYFDVAQVRVLQEDVTESAARANSDLTSGKITRAEAREAGGLEFDDTDDVYYIPSGLQVVPRGEMPPPPVAPVVPDAGDGDIDMEEEDGDDKVEEQEEESEDVDMERASFPTPAHPGTNGRGAHAEVLEAPVLIRADGIPAESELIAAFERGVDAAETTYGTQLAAFFEDVGEAIYDGAGGQMTEWITLAVQSEESLSKLATEVSVVMDRVDVGAMAVNDMTPIYEALYAEVLEGTTGAVSSSVGVGVNLPDERQRQVIADGGRRVGIVDIRKQQKDAMFNALSVARSDGLGVDAAARKVREYLSAGPFPNAGVDYRAKLIARTEAKHAQRVSALELYDEAGWRVVALDGQLGDASDDDCKARNGKEYSIAEAKVEMNSPITHPNCTLSFMPKVV